MLTDYYNLQGFMKNKPLRGRLGRWRETLFCYDLDIVYQTGKTNLADGLSRKPNYKAVAEVEDWQKEAERQAEDKRSLVQVRCPREVQTGTESEEDREEVIRICLAQLLEPWK